MVVVVMVVVCGICVIAECVFAVFAVPFARSGAYFQCVSAGKIMLLKHNVFACGRQTDLCTRMSAGWLILLKVCMYVCTPLVQTDTDTQTHQIYICARALV